MGDRKFTPAGGAKLPKLDAATTAAVLAWRKALIEQRAAREACKPNRSASQQEATLRRAIEAGRSEAALRQDLMLLLVGDA